MPSSETSIEVAETRDVVVVRIDGPATMSLGPSFSALCDRCRERDDRSIWVDLSNCTWLDSTFAGCLLSQCLKARKKHESGFALVAASSGCKQTLTSMGVDRLLIDERATLPSPLNYVPVSDFVFTAECLAETVIDAHDQLASVNDANRETFGAVAAAFRADLERKRKNVH